MMLEQSIPKNRGDEEENFVFVNDHLRAWKHAPICTHLGEEMLTY